MTNDLLHKWDPVKYPTDGCEICEAAGAGYVRDGVRHALLGCQDPTVHGLVTKRHNKAVREVAKAIRRGEEGREPHACGRGCVGRRREIGRDGPKLGLGG